MEKGEREKANSNKPILEDLSDNLNQTPHNTLHGKESGKIKTK